MNLGEERKYFPLQSFKLSTPEHRVIEIAYWGEVLVYCSLTRRYFLFYKFYPEWAETRKQELGAYIGILEV